MSRQQIDTVGKTETFFTRNVKLITFLICVSIILSPFVVTYIKDVLEERRLAARPEMTVEELMVIAERGKNLQQRDLEKFADYREEADMQDMKYAFYRIPVKHQRDLTLSISFAADHGYLFSFNLMDMDTREELDLLSEADKLEDFLATPQKLTQ